MYDNPGDKIIHEAFLHQRFDVKLHSSFYNKANQTPFGFDTSGMKMSEFFRNNCRERATRNNNFKDKFHSEETKQYLSMINKGKKYSEETKQKHRKRKRKSWSDDTKHKISKGNLGKIVSEESRQLMRNSKTNFYVIFDEFMSIKYTIRGSFLKEMSNLPELPKNALLESYRKEGQKIFLTERSQHTSSFSQANKFKGWSCIKMRNF